MKLYQLQVTQEYVRDIKNVVYWMNQFKLQKEIPEVSLVEFEDKVVYIHDGHTRAIASILFFDVDSSVTGNLPNTIRKMKYKDYMYAYPSKGFYTPFDPRTEVRHTDFFHVKKFLEEKLNEDFEGNQYLLEECAQLYKKKRDISSLEQLADKYVFLKGE